MTANRAALLRAVAARFAAIAGREREVLQRQRLEVQNLVAVHVDDRRFRRRQEKPVLAALLVRQMKHIVPELRELTGGISALIEEEVRRQQERVAVAVMFLTEVVEQRPLEGSALGRVQ